MTSFASKNSGYYFGPDTVCEDTGMEEDDYYAQAKELAEKHGGECLSTTCESPHFILTYRCKLGHIFESAEVLLSNQWCLRCAKILQKAKLFAKEHEGVCLSECVDSSLEFQCDKGHRWAADILKYTHQKWCQKCALSNRKTKKQVMLEEQQRMEEEQARLQEELFNEAKQKMQSTTDVNNAAILSTENHIDKSARSMTSMFMESPKYSGECTYEQIFCVYKILNASNEFIHAKYLSQEGKEQVASFYRQLARALHPDKNKHPLAGEAFLKVSNVYAAAISS